MKKMHAIDILIALVILVLVATSVAVVTAAPRKEKPDYLVSPDMTKFMENEGHGQVFDEGDMQ